MHRNKDQTRLFAKCQLSLILGLLVTTFQSHRGQVNDRVKHEPVKQKVPVKKGKTEKSNGYDEKKYLLRRERQSET